VVTAIDSGVDAAEGDSAAVALVAGDRFTSAAVVYTPAADYAGFNGFTYTVAVISEGTGEMPPSARLPAAVTITVTEVYDPLALSAYNAVLTMEPFQLIDIDAWETGAADEVRVVAQLDGAAHSDGAHVNAVKAESLALASTQNLYFTHSDGLGKGYDDSAMAFVSDLSSASDAVSQISGTFHKELLQRNVSLTLQGNDTGVTGGLVDHEGNPLCDVAMDIHGVYYSSDVTVCVLGALVQPVIVLCDSALRCQVNGTLPVGQYDADRQRAERNAQRITIVLSPVVTSLHPTMGSSSGGETVVVILADDVATAASLYCCLSGQYTTGVCLTATPSGTPQPPR
jgi:hypothetical protein